MITSNLSANARSANPVCGSAAFLQLVPRTGGREQGFGRRGEKPQRPKSPLRYLAILFFSFFLPGTLLAAYTYYYSDNLTSINLNNWQQNGTVTAPRANGGSLISKLTVPVPTSQYEVNPRLTPAANGRSDVQYLAASLDAMTGPVAAGSFFSVWEKLGKSRVSP